MLPLTAIDGRRQGGRAIVALREGKRVVLVADEDADAVRVIDPDGPRQLESVWVGGRPGEIAVAADGRAYVALASANELAVLEAQAPGLRRVGTIATDAEPVGLALDESGWSLYVTAAWGRTLAEVSIAGGAVHGRVPLAREPRGVVVAEGVAYVTHAIGSRVSRVPLATFAEEGASATTALPLDGFDVLTAYGRPGSTAVRRVTSQGFGIVDAGDRVLAPLAVVHVGRSTVTGRYGQVDGYPSNEPAVAVVTDGGVRLRLQNDVVAVDGARPAFGGGIGRMGCMLPRAAAVDRAGSLLLVGCVDRGEVHAWGLADEALSVSARGRWRVPAGPLGIDVDAEGRRAYVWSQFDRALSIIPLPARGEGDAHLRAARVRVARIGELAPDDGASVRLDDAARLGRQLFHLGRDLRVSADGRACASCHVDGRDDGLTWSSPDGALQTPMLAGRLAGTAPFGWRSGSHDLVRHVGESVRRLGGTGLEPMELEALAAWLTAMPAPSPAASGSASDPVARGRDLFHAEEVGCASCHRDGGGSDGASHEVGSGLALDTPSLRFVAGTAPYFHDGRYATLGDMLRATRGQMGWGAHLDDPALGDLEAYLLSL